MKICLIGDGLISLTLAKALVNKNAKVFVYYKNNKKISSTNRTIGISSYNMNFIQDEIIKINKKYICPINQIEIYNEENNEKILNFENKKKNLFSIIKSDDFYSQLLASLKKNSNFKKLKIKNNSFYTNINRNKNFDLIINCDASNDIQNKYFYKKIYKDYKSKAFATVVNHKKTINKKAIQIFTKYGPLAFLPISSTETSVVYSIKKKNFKDFFHFDESDLIKLINKYNKKYKINYIYKFESTDLNLNILRNYCYKNILAFGDTLHQIHPLAGQGFNMTLRDIKVFIRLMKEKENLGLPIDSFLYKEFEKKTKHLNFLFASTNDIIYEFFNYDNLYLKNISKKIFSYLQNNKKLNNFAVKYADRGLFF